MPHLNFLEKQAAFEHNIHIRIKATNGSESLLHCLLWPINYKNVCFGPFRHMLPQLLHHHLKINFLLYIFLKSGTWLCHHHFVGLAKCVMSSQNGQLARN